MNIETIPLDILSKYILVSISSSKSGLYDNLRMCPISGMSYCHIHISGMLMGLAEYPFRFIYFDFLKHIEFSTVLFKVVDLCQTKSDIKPNYQI